MAQKRNTARRPHATLSPSAHQQRVTLDRALSKLGVCSRQQARAAIHALGVRVNGKTVASPLAWVRLEHDVIEFKGRQVGHAPPRVYLMLNKPTGFVTTRRDNLLRARPTVFDLLPEPFHKKTSRKPSPRATWIFPIGRLDMDSEGLLLFTNDGTLGEVLASPQGHVPKTYRVQVQRLPTPEEIKYLETGVPLGDETTLPVRIELEKTRERESPTPSRASHGEGESWLRITIREGKNRQVRRMFAAVHCDVLRLIRVRFGPLQLGDLAPGKWRNLTEPEIRLLRRATTSSPRPGE